LDVLSQAEGLSEDAANTAILQRGDVAIRASGRNDQDLKTIRVDLKRLLESGNPDLNIDIYPGDRVTIPRAGLVYVVGAVNKPGGFIMSATTHGMTVLQALALAQDTKPTARRDQSMILRNDPQSPEGRKQIQIDLKKILRGQAPDPILQAEDILFVPDSAGKRALTRSVDSIVQVATGMAIYGSRF